ncbi:MAG TPA: hypothetical protein VMT50_01950 [Steroidobacteraceae bacterium]|nr:hypothetical protein [Steroidobacteraceae bacterium]
MKEAGLPILGALGWRLLARRPGRPVGAAAEPSAPTGSGFAAWADAACPACLAVAVVARATVTEG